MGENNQASGQNAAIKVVGVGGGGCNILDCLAAAPDIDGVELIAVNTDKESLAARRVAKKIIIGTSLPVEQTPGVCRRRAGRRRWRR